MSTRKERENLAGHLGRRHRNWKEVKNNSPKCSQIKHREEIWRWETCYRWWSWERGAFPFGLCSRQTTAANSLSTIWREEQGLQEWRHPRIQPEWEWLERRLQPQLRANQCSYWKIHFFLEMWSLLVLLCSTLRVQKCLGSALWHSQQRDARRKQSSLVEAEQTGQYLDGWERWTGFEQGEKKDLSASSPVYFDIWREFWCRGT